MENLFQSLEYSTLRNLSLTVENLNTLQKDEQRLINLFWSSTLPKRDENGQHYAPRAGKEVRSRRASECGRHPSW